MAKKKNVSARVNKKTPTINQVEDVGKIDTQGEMEVPVLDREAQLNL